MRSRTFAVLATFLLTFILAAGGSARVWKDGDGGCGNGFPPPDTLPDPDPTWDPLGKYHRYGTAPGEFHISDYFPTFANIFDLWLTDDVAARWDSAGVWHFINRTLDEDSTNTDDIFPRVWEYFTDADQDPRYGHVEYHELLDDSVYTKFTIKLYSPADFTGPACGYRSYWRECENYSREFRPDEGEWLNRARTVLCLAADSVKNCELTSAYTVDDALTDAFAHEFQHVCSALNPCARFYENVDESLSKLAEYIVGGQQNTACDVSYDASVMRGDRCEPPRKYLVELTWMAYLYDGFKGNSGDITDDLVYRWIRESNVENPSKTELTPRSLANVLDDVDYASLGGSTGDVRLRNLFQNFCVAKFADAPMFVDGQFGFQNFNPLIDVALMLDNCGYHALGSCPQRPIDCWQLPKSDCLNHVACWNARILPPSYVLTSNIENANAAVVGIYEDADGSRDSVEVATYGTDFIVFKADSYFETGEHELHFDLTGRSVNLPTNTELRASVIAYSTAEDTLQLHPEDIVFVAPLTIAPGNNTCSFVITDFGRSIKSAVVCLTLVETNPQLSNQYYPYNTFGYFVYDYEYGVYTPESVSSLQWSGDVFVVGDYNVPDGTTLTVDEGTAVRVWTDDLANVGISNDHVEFRVYGECQAFGSSSAPITFTAWDMNGSSANDDDWWGIYVESGGEGTFEHCVVRNGRYGIQANAPISLTGCLIENTSHLGVSIAYAGTVSIDSTTIRGPDYGVNALLGTQLILDHSTIEDCPLYGAAVYKDSSIKARGSTFNNNDTGVYLSKETESWVKATLRNCTFNDNVDGIWIDEVGDSAVSVRGCAIDGSTTNGIYVRGAGDVSIADNSITYAQVGVNSYNSAPEVRSGNVIQHNNNGVKCDVGSYAVVESCTVNYNLYGFTVLDGAGPNLGQYSGGSSNGHNIIKPNTTYHVRNYSNYTVVAQQNYWPQKLTEPIDCNPKSTYLYGPVDYSYPLCDSPSLTSLAYLPQGGDDGGKEAPKTFGLGQNYPNPFNPSTTVTYQVPTRSNVELAIYDVTGRLVAVLVNDERSAGTYTAHWNGRDRAGRPAASGMYFVRMRAASFVETKKLLLIK